MIEICPHLLVTHKTVEANLVPGLIENTGSGCNMERCKIRVSGRIRRRRQAEGEVIIKETWVSEGDPNSDCVSKDRIPDPR